jgi:hypothetical protein
MSTKVRGDVQNVSDPAEFLAPPLAPTIVSIPGDALPEYNGREESFGPSPAHGSAFAIVEQSYSPDRKARLRGKLIVGTAIVATLALGTLAYFFLPPVSEKTASQPQTEGPTQAFQSPPEAPMRQTQPDTWPSGRPAASPTIAWPDPPPTVTPERTDSRVESAPQVPTAAKGKSAAIRPPAPQDRNVLFLQRPGVNVRSSPSPTGRVVGSARKGTRFEVTNREGEWVQVESWSLKGWINTRFLGLEEPR